MFLIHVQVDTCIPRKFVEIENCYLLKLKIADNHMSLAVCDLFNGSFEYIYDSYYKLHLFILQFDIFVLRNYLLVIPIMSCNVHGKYSVISSNTF